MKVNNKLSKESLFDRHGLTIGQLKKFLQEHPDLKDDAPVLVERVEDFYFDKNNWGVYLKEGEHYHNILKLNEKMRQEIKRREQGLNPDYHKIKEPSSFIQEPTEEDMTQYIPTWCCVKYADENILFINLHY